MASPHSPTGKDTGKPRPLLLDGGLATSLEDRGFSLPKDLWSAGIHLSSPEAVGRVQRDFALAGADVVTTASYQMHRQNLEAHGIEPGKVAEVYLSTVSQAKSAVDGLGRRIRIAASIGPYGALSGDGAEYGGNYGLSAKGLRAFHEERFRILAHSGPDFLAIETIPDRSEVEALLALVDEGNCPAWLALSCRDERHLADGTPLRDLVRSASGVKGLVAIGVNCVAPGMVLPLLEEIASATDTPLIAYPNSGETWDGARRQWSGGTGDFLAHAKSWLGLPLFALGGCCRVDGRTIQELARLLALQA